VRNETKYKQKEGKHMFTVNIHRLTEAIREADALELPYMNEGTAYLYNMVYSRLVHDEDVLLSELNFDAFELDDVNTIDNLYSDVFERDLCAAGNITSALRKIVPASMAVSYV
jgi:hypothetical protein